MRILSCGVCLAGALSASAASAQVSQSYGYDAHGRLIGVTTTGSAGANSVSYTYDDANNRTLRGQNGVTAWAALRSLPTDHPLLPHQALTSPDGRWSLALRPSGRLELWSANTHVPSELARAFELTSQGEARFLPLLAREGMEARLELASDGSLRMVGGADEVLWRSDVANAPEDAQ